MDAQFPAFGESGDALTRQARGEGTMGRGYVRYMNTFYVYKIKGPVIPCLKHHTHAVTYISYISETGIPNILLCLRGSAVFSGNSGSLPH